MNYKKKKKLQQHTLLQFHETPVNNPACEKISASQLQPRNGVCVRSLLGVYFWQLCGSSSLQDNSVMDFY